MFPRKADNNFQGYRLVVIVYLVITVFTIARSLIHILLPDGGAGNIAGIDVTVEGGQNVVSVFAVWGLSQLLMGFVYLVVFFRYKSLIPFMYLLVLAEYSGRIALGLIKPFEVAHPPPGAIGNYLLVPLAIIMLILSLKGPKRSIVKKDKIS